MGWRSRFHDLPIMSGYQCEECTLQSSCYSSWQSSVGTTVSQLALWTSYMQATRMSIFRCAARQSISDTSRLMLANELTSYVSWWMFGVGLLAMMLKMGDETNVWNESIEQTWLSSWLWVWPCVWVWLGRVKSLNSNSEPWVSAPSNSASSVSRKVRVCELGPYASTLISSQTAITCTKNKAMAIQRNVLRPSISDTSATFAEKST